MVEAALAVAVQAVGALAVAGLVVQAAAVSPLVVKAAVVVARSAHQLALWAA